MTWRVQNCDRRVLFSKKNCLCFYLVIHLRARGIRMELTAILLSLIFYGVLGKFRTAEQIDFSQESVVYLT